MSNTQRSRLSIGKIETWAEGHYQRTGRWPTVRSGAVVEAPAWDWSMIDGCLEFGGAGVPGGSSLVLLVAGLRGAVKERPQPRLSAKLILQWADRHYMRTGKWPDVASGPVKGIGGETWRRIDQALRNGDRGMDGGGSLRRLLATHRRKAKSRLARPPELRIPNILKWVDEHFERTATWPSSLSGEIKACPGDTWKKIDSCLRKGNRGLPGKSSLAKLLQQHRGKRFRSRGPRLTVEQILAWADSHHQRTGRWPGTSAGRVHEATKESWLAISAALKLGSRGLPKGTTLAGLLARERGALLQGYKKPLTVDRILGWADEYHERTGRWPTSARGSVHGVDGETWGGVRNSIWRGLRGLSGGTTLRQLLFKHRPEARVDYRGRPLLSVPKILEWADEYHARTGLWPSSLTGKIKGAPGETWQQVNMGLRRGQRGLEGSTTLTKFLHEHRGKRFHEKGTTLTVEQILAWADSHYKRTGRWPGSSAGRVYDAPKENWLALIAALSVGSRGLPKGTSLARLLSTRRLPVRSDRARSRTRI